MGYDGAMFLASLVLLLPIAAGGGLLWFVLRRLRCIPSGAASVPGYGLIVLSGYAILFLGTAVQTLLIEPARLQVKYLGQVYGTPLTLRIYDHSGFQDPVDEWVYSIGSEAIVGLSKYCLPQPVDRRRCYVFSDKDDRWDAAVWLEGSDLHIQDGLH